MGRRPTRRPAATSPPSCRCTPATATWAISASVPALLRSAPPMTPICPPTPRPRRAARVHALGGGRRPVLLARGCGRRSRRRDAALGVGRSADLTRPADRAGGSRRRPAPAARAGGSRAGGSRRRPAPGERHPPCWPSRNSVCSSETCRTAGGSIRAASRSLRRPAPARSGQAPRRDAVSLRPPAQDLQELAAKAGLDPVHEPRGHLPPLPGREPQPLVGGGHRDEHPVADDRAVAVGRGVQQARAAHRPGGRRRSSQSGSHRA